MQTLLGLVAAHRRGFRGFVRERGTGRILVWSVALRGNRNDAASDANSLRLILTNELADRRECERQTNERLDLGH